MMLDATRSVVGGAVTIGVAVPIGYADVYVSKFYVLFIYIFIYIYVYSNYSFFVTWLYVECFMYMCM
jgi:hypothetical protein